MDSNPVHERHEKHEKDESHAEVAEKAKPKDIGLTQAFWSGFTLRSLRLCASKQFMDLAGKKASLPQRR